MQGQWPPGKRLPGWMASPVLVTVFQAPKLHGRKNAELRLIRVSSDVADFAEDSALPIQSKVQNNPCGWGCEDAICNKLILGVELSWISAKII